MTAKNAHWAKPIADTPKTFLVQDIEELVGSSLPSLANATRRDLAKIIEAIKTRDERLMAPRKDAS